MTLREQVIEIINDEARRCDNEEWLSDFCENGSCQDGWISSLNYYDDIVDFYDIYESEIVDLLKETMDQIGAKNPTEIFGDRWDDSWPIADERQNKMVLAWFAFEKIANEINEENIEKKSKELDNFGIDF